jgi:hypothetical protein
MGYAVCCMLMLMCSVQAQAPASADRYRYLRPSGDMGHTQCVMKMKNAVAVVPPAAADSYALCPMLMTRDTSEHLHPPRLSCCICCM